MSCRPGGLITLLSVVLSLVSLGVTQDAADTSQAPWSAVPLQSEGLASQTFGPPRSNHVVVIMEENRSTGQAAQYMAYLGALAAQYGQGLQVYSDSHGSWLAYGELTSGLHPFNGEGDNGICNGDGCSGTIYIDNIVRRLVAAGKTWRGYFQSMPSVGYMGYQYGNYVRRHNPFPFYSDVANNPAQQQNMVPSDPYMLQDILSNNLANFTWISPDLVHDAHNGNNDQLALIIADYYLRSFVPQLLVSPPFQSNGDGVLLVTFDEGEPQQDNRCGGNPDPNNCGGNIWSVIIGPKVRPHHVSNVHYMQGSQFRLICDLLGVSSCPGDGASSPSMSEFFLGVGPQ
jgi:hypothetical protein